MAVKACTDAGAHPGPRLMTGALSAPEIAVLVVQRFRICAAFHCQSGI